MNQSLREEVLEWIAVDPDDDDRSTLRSLLDDDDEVELERRFAAPLTFGTAGLRGPEMAGPAGMNRTTVRRATLAVIEWLKEIGVSASDGVVVGRDARHGSERFNDEVVGVLLGAGAVVYEMPSALPTPFVPYCVKALHAAAGIMITASHNPPLDNGYKLYARDGAQIIPPDDEIVERHMKSVGNAVLADRSVADHFAVPDALLEEYRTHVVRRFGVGASDLRITYTPLHGVGGDVMTTLLADAGYVNVTKVVRQFEPDGDFPTLPFPNPEEPGALDLAIATANESDSTLIIANDPDADRLGAAVRSGEQWRVLRGDEIGWLLASFLIDGVGERHETLATTIVSSTLLEKLAYAKAVDFATTLTGFKWIARAGGDRALGFGYEEALGFAVDPLVADKDGMSGGLALAALANELASKGQSLLDRLDDIESAYGVHLTSQLSFRVDGREGLAKIAAVVDRLRSEPPRELGRIDVSEVVDLAKGWRGLLPTDGLWFTLGSRGRVVVRPSGTEAKVKAYVEITPPLEGSLEAQRALASELMASVCETLTSLLRL